MGGEEQKTEAENAAGDVTKVYKDIRDLAKANIGKELLGEETIRELLKLHIDSTRQDIIEAFPELADSKIRVSIDFDDRDFARMSFTDKDGNKKGDIPFLV